MRRIRYALILLVALALVGCASPPREGKLVMKDGRWVRGPAPVEGTPGGELALIQLHVDEEQYSDAVSQVEKFLKRYESHPGREEALMLAGEAQEARDRGMQAYAWYEKQLDEYPAGKLSERALRREFDIASGFLAGKKQVIWGFLRLSAEDEGIEILMRIAEHAPLSSLAEDSLLLVGDYYFADRKYAQAAQSYDDCVDLFPKSPRSAYTSYRAARAMLATYRGVKHRDTPLIEAMQRFSLFKQQYPVAAEDMKVDKTLAKIRGLMAHQDFNTAMFYERVGRPQAAEFYYRQVTARHGETQWSPRANESLKRLALESAQAKAEGSQ